jgi:hypothetical protein
MDVALKFWPKVEKTSNCWLWTGKCNKAGYGLVSCGGMRYTGAHRVSYMLHHGSIPAGALVLHKCDNRPCVNPSHLYLGDYFDNAKDMVDRWRTRTKLSRETVQAIRRDQAAGCISPAILARKYDISKGIVQHIMHGRTFANVTI